ncbi:MAG: NYN domain-containing protein [Deferrisomatales bacterium]
MLLIDGHNLIGRTPGLSLAREEEGRERVLRRIAARKGSGGRPVVVVFDGPRPGGAREERFGGVRVVFAPASRTADGEILRRLRAGNPRAATVVTSDRKLADRAASLGAEVWSCERFWASLTKEKTRPRSPPDKPRPSREDVETWLRLFREGPERQGHKM